MNPLHGRFAARARRAMLLPVVLVLTGCGLVSQNPPEMPDIIKQIDAARSQYAPENNPLLNVAVGTQLDAISSLAGCWGSYIT